MPFIIERGADWYLTVGKPPKNTGPKLYCLSGHVKRPGVYEAPLGLPMKELIYELGGGMLARRPAAQGRDPGRLVRAGARAADVRRRSRFRLARREGDDARLRGDHGDGLLDVHGRGDGADRALLPPRILRPVHAVPRRVAAGSSACLNRIEAGTGMQQDLDLLLSVSNNIIGNTICALGDAAAMPAISFVTKFRDEFQHHIDHRSCLTGTLAAPGSPLMPKVVIDGEELEVAAGTTILQAALTRGREIPHYCYHAGLSIAGNCRMCLVEVEKAPKLVIGCYTPVAEGMVVHTREREGQAGAVRDDGVLPHQPPARLPDLRSGGRVPPAGIRRSSTATG